MGRKKTAARKAEAPATVKGTAAHDEEAPLKPGEAARIIERALRNLHKMGAFRTPYYDRLMDPDRPGPTIEEVEQIPVEDLLEITADWPGPKLPTQRS